MEVTDAADRQNLRVRSSGIGTCGVDQLFLGESRCLSLLTSLDKRYQCQGALTQSQLNHVVSTTMR